MNSLDWEQPLRTVFGTILALLATSTHGQFRYENPAKAVLHGRPSVADMLRKIFYFGYLTGSFVSGRGLQYFHAGKYIGANFFVWGCTLVGCIGVQNYAGLLVLRFLLGCA